MTVHFDERAPMVLGIAFMATSAPVVEGLIMNLELVQ